MSATNIPTRATLKIARAKDATTSGISTILIKSPGTPGSSEGRLIEGGSAWFETPHHDDYVCIFVTDEDDILGYGEGATIGTYTDTDLDTANQGWYIPYPKGWADLSTFGGIGFIPAGLYLKVIATKGDASSDTFRMNVKWGKRD